MIGQKPQNWNPRFELLDGLRGIACLGVLLHHLGVTTLGHYFVMIFFVISGYCITTAAQLSLRQGLQFSAFMKRRIRRIYPPYLCALAFFFVTRIARAHFTDAPLWHPSIVDWIQNVTLTQWISLLLHPAEWPSDNPKLFVAAFWSLNYEEQFYLVIAIVLVAVRKYSISTSKTILAISTVGLVWNFIWPGGWITGLFIEYWLHFSLGAAVYFFLCESSDNKDRVVIGALIAGLGLVSMAHILFKGGNFTEVGGRAYLELALLSGFSFVLILIRPLSAQIGRAVLWKPVAMLGTISYSLYLVHQFNLNLVDTIVRSLLPPSFSVSVVILKVLFHIAIGAAFWFACERPFLNKRTTSAVVHEKLSSTNPMPSHGRSPLP